MSQEFILVLGCLFQGSLQGVEGGGQGRAPWIASVGVAC